MDQVNHPKTAGETVHHGKSSIQTATSANSPGSQTDWQRVKWRKVHRLVRNLRHRIFRAAKVEDWDKVQSLQRLMLRSYANTLLSVRQITQRNDGKRTAGVDKLVALTPAARGQLVDRLMVETPWHVSPVKRVYIPKINGTLRPLGMPTILDRCRQARVKNALEPAWEAHFEATSYGFRPGRSCHDAIARIYTLAQGKARRKWVVDTDIKGAFDHLDHTYLLQAIGAFPGRESIRQWLQAGYLDTDGWHPTDTGTPQGGPLSPLLLNVALHGLEAALGVSYDKWGSTKPSTRLVVRYADALVVFCPTQEDAQETVTRLETWLAQRGLRLAAEKTRLVHLTEGFTFLGFQIKLYPTSRGRSGYKLLITPSREAVQRLRKRLRAIWHAHRGQAVQVVLGRLNPLIRGWAHYFRIGVASATFNALDRFMLHRAMRYVNRRHPTKSHAWHRAKYWGPLHPQRKDTWVFGDTRTGAFLLKFRWFPIQRHILVPGTASPDDPTLRDYWAARAMARAKDLPPSRRKLALQQNGRCRQCGESLFNGEALHVHHKLPRAQGGTDTYANLELLHASCHQHHHGRLRKRMPGRPQEPAPLGERMWFA